jgi:hypothetical protein
MDGNNQDLEFLIEIDLKKKNPRCIEWMCTPRGQLAIIMSTQSRGADGCQMGPLLRAIVRFAT